MQWEKIIRLLHNGLKLYIVLYVTMHSVQRAIQWIKRQRYNFGIYRSMKWIGACCTKEKKGTGLRTFMYNTRDSRTWI